MRRVAWERVSAFPTLTTDYSDVLHDPAIDAVHICTPNALHFPMAKDALQAGKHVICEKPLATTVEEGARTRLPRRSSGVRNCICHGLRGYPMVQQMRRLCEAGDLGEILVVQGTYFQDWLLYDTDWNWRVDRKRVGLRAPWPTLARIGLIWPSTSPDYVLAVSVPIFRPFTPRASSPNTRSRPLPISCLAHKTILKHSWIRKISAPSFFVWADAHAEPFTASQVSAGRKNRLNIEVCGTRLPLRGTRSVPTNFG